MTGKHIPILTWALVPLIAFTAGNAPISADDHGTIEEITVVAPRIIIERPAVGVTEVVTADMNARVSLADLDLTRSADVITLEERIRGAATEICEELEREYPFGEPTTPVCIRRAIEDAEKQVREAIQMAGVGADQSD